MTTQRWLRRRIATLERQQEQRIEHVAKLKKELDELLERKQRELDNFHAQVTMKVAR